MEAASKSLGTCRATSRASAVCQPYRRLLRCVFLDSQWKILIVLGAFLVPVAMANAMPPGAEKVPLNCTTPADDWLGNAQNNFDMGSWLSRGLCVRRGLSYWSPVSTYECYARLENVLINNINGIRTAEYGGAAGVLALLPTIGALLGTPTNEIWHLLNMIPFGGFIAMACSFGGAILPVKPKDYESGFMKKYMKNTLHFRARTNSNLALPTTLDPHEQDRIKRRADILLEKVARKLQDERRRKVPKMYILYGLTGMLLLLCVAQAAMVLIEFGAVLPWWCQSKWWVHLWYLMGEFVHLRGLILLNHRLNESSPRQYVNRQLGAIAIRQAVDALALRRSIRLNSRWRRPHYRLR